MKYFYEERNKKSSRSWRQGQYNVDVHVLNWTCRARSLRGCAWTPVLSLITSYPSSPLGTRPGGAPPTAWSRVLSVAKLGYIIERGRPVLSNVAMSKWRQLTCLSIISSTWWILVHPNLVHSIRISSKPLRAKVQDFIASMNLLSNSLRLAIESWTRTNDRCLPMPILYWDTCLKTWSVMGLVTTDVTPSLISLT